MSAIGLHRLYSQRISTLTFNDAGEVVAWLGAMQGQDFEGTKWAFGVRLNRMTYEAINQALDRGTMLRTWVFRGTLHYVSPADIHWMVALIAPFQIAGNARRYKELELDEATLALSTAHIVEALDKRKHLTRTELFAVLEEKGLSPAKQRGFYMLQRAGLDRQVYQGPMIGNETTFLRLGEGVTFPQDQALAELARRYFTSHGPATLNDFAAWSGLPMGVARVGLEAAKSGLLQETTEGKTYFCSPDATQPPSHPVYFLPGFDEFVLGYRDRSAVLEPQFSDAICPGGNGVFFPTIVSNGRIIGTWKRTLRKKVVEITVSAFRPLSGTDKAAIEEAAARFGLFMGRAVQMQYPLIG